MGISPSDTSKRQKAFCVNHSTQLCSDSVFQRLMKPASHRPFPWRLFLCELSGTAVLVLGGLTLVIGMFGTGSPMRHLVPSEKLRQVIAGFLFGSLGASIALSLVGK